jgi:hypothetical protein
MMLLTVGALRDITARWCDSEEVQRIQLVEQRKNWSWVTPLLHVIVCQKKDVVEI